MANIFVPHVTGERLQRLKKQAAYRKKITLSREVFAFEVSKWLLGREGEYHRKMTEFLYRHNEKGSETGTVIVTSVCKHTSFYNDPENWNIGLDMKIIPGSWYNEIKEKEVNDNFNLLSNSNVIKYKEKNRDVSSMLTFETLTTKQAEAYNELKLVLMSEQYY
jgi:hypothetical protein